MSTDIKDLEKLLKKTYGDDLVVGLENYQVNCISTGCFELDVAMGTGGFPRGRISVIAGVESSGKTSIALKTIAQAQKEGLTCAYIDVEATFDIKRAEQLGINVDDLLLVRANAIEVAGEACVDLAKSGKVGMIVFDSVAAASVKSLEEGEISDSLIGKKAKMLGHLMAKLSGPIWANNVCMIFINQLRDSLDPYKPKPVMPGGHALPYAASVIVHLTSSEIKDAKGDVLIKAFIHKNKLAVPFKRTEFIMTTEGIVDENKGIASILATEEMCRELGIVKAASWYTIPPVVMQHNEEGEVVNEIQLFDSETKIQGEKELVKIIQENSQFKDAVKSIILNKYTRVD